MSDPKKPYPAAGDTGAAPLPQKNGDAPPSGGAARHEERRLDEALEETFPASDPVAEHPSAVTRKEAETPENEVVEHEECLLDEALELTFPASDPIAVADPGAMAKSGRGDRRSAAR